MPPATLDSPVRLETASVRYGPKLALEAVNLTVQPGRVYGLIGRNGAGKSTLLQVMAGLCLPTEGQCHTLGVRSDLLDTPELSQLGSVLQTPSFIEWMNVRQHLDFTASFYPRWDRALEKSLLQRLEIDPHQRLTDLNPGDRQKVALMLAVCHRPRLLLLDEPMSALDPIIRRQVIEHLFRLMLDEETTVIISSHLLTDLEKVVDWILFLDQGRLVEDCAWDQLQESFADWVVYPGESRLPDRFPEPFVLTQIQQGTTARLRVRLTQGDEARAFAARYGARIEAHPLTLDGIFTTLAERRPHP